ncbi:MAG: hypothetical protein ABI689_12270 [Thermoanaerobaculia bacterium]
MLRGVAVLLACCGAAAWDPAAAVAADAPAAGAERLPATRAFTLPEPIELPPQARELAERYREVFKTLASGDRVDAVGRAAALEAQTLATNPDKAIEWLNLADGSLLRTYLQARPDCALPLIVFYQRLVLAHAAKGRYRLVPRTLQVADRLLEQMTLTAGTRAERRLTADAYAGFAADLLTVPAPTRGAEMLARGLELAPDDFDGNIALAILLLRDRRPNDAESRLELVLKAQPGNREARLRRTLMRSGFSADGRTGQELDKLATGGENDWIALVAAQERTRRLLATGDFDKSTAFLNRVLERFPGDSSLRVALAFAAARSGRRAESYLAAKSALATRAAAGEGARRIFAELPIRLLRQQATRANAAADARTPSLSAALASAPAAPAIGTPETTSAAPVGSSR